MNEARSMTDIFFGLTGQVSKGFIEGVVMNPVDFRTLRDVYCKRGPLLRRGRAMWRGRPS
jgi:hypothetical protein